MSPRVLFHHSIPRTFVENQARADRMLIYFRMVQEELGRSWRLPECIPVLEFSRPDWVLPHCRGFFLRSGNTWAYTIPKLAPSAVQWYVVLHFFLGQSSLPLQTRKPSIHWCQAWQLVLWDAVSRCKPFLYLKLRELVARRIERGWRWREFDGNGPKSAVIRGYLSWVVITF
jgi:hypothetical protein